MQSAKFILTIFLFFFVSFSKNIFSQQSVFFRQKVFNSVSNEWKVDREEGVIDYIIDHYELERNFNNQELIRFILSKIIDEYEKKSDEISAKILLRDVGSVLSSMQVFLMRRTKRRRKIIFFILFGIGFAGFAFLVAKLVKNKLKSAQVEKQEAFEKAKALEKALQEGKILCDQKICDLSKSTSDLLHLSEEESKKKKKKLEEEFVKKLVEKEKDLARITEELAEELAEKNEELEEKEDELESKNNRISFLLSNRETLEERLERGQKIIEALQTALKGRDSTIEYKDLNIEIQRREIESFKESEESLRNSIKKIREKDFERAHKILADLKKNLDLNKKERKKVKDALEANKKRIEKREKEIGSFGKKVFEISDTVGKGALFGLSAWIGSRGKSGL